MTAVLAWQQVMNVNSITVYDGGGEADLLYALYGSGGGNKTADSQEDRIV
jgi:hypothetical protein